MTLFALWSGTTAAASPGLRVLLRLRARRGKEIAERLPERRGIESMPRPPGRLIWLHAASVGETVSVLPVLSALACRPDSPAILLTTGTVTSKRLLDLRLPELGLQERVIHRFVPLDVPSWVARFLDHWRPDAAGFVESELWPNLLRACRARSIPLMLINARLSPRSFARWRLITPATKLLLGSFARIEAQSSADAERLRALGAASVSSPGNLKFAAQPLPVDDAELARIRSLLGDRPVWLAASTHPGEEEIISSVHQMLADTYPTLLTVLAPRHPERGAAICSALGSAAVTRRGAGQDPPEVRGIWVADTLGELGLLYRLAGTAFVGRSLLPPGGGQNPLEAARLGCPVAVGPYTGNFQEAVEVLTRSGALATVADARALAAWVHRMLSDKAARERSGEAGVAAAARFAELPGQTADTLLGLLALKPR